MFADRAEYLDAANADGLMRFAAAESNEYAGDQDMYGYYVTLVHVDQDMIAEYVRLEGDPWVSANVEAGWRLVKINSDGIVWGAYYETEEAAVADFEGEEAAFDEFVARALGREL